MLFLVSFSRLNLIVTIDLSMTVFNILLKRTAIKFVSLVYRATEEKKIDHITIFEKVSRTEAIEIMRMTNELNKNKN